MGGWVNGIHGYVAGWFTEKVIKGWDIGVATMAEGELARFIIAPEYAYGSKGFAPKVTDGVSTLRLRFRVVLVARSSRPH